MAKSGKNAKDVHPAFSYDCSTKEEAAYIASMAHRLLKPTFARMCLEGTETREPARPGDWNYFTNNIWGLWKLCRFAGPNGRDYILGALSGEGERPVFLVDYNLINYQAMMVAPFFNRRTVNRRKNYEPVQPILYLDDDNRVHIYWRGLSEVVLGEKMELPPSRLIGIDYRKDALLGKNVFPLYEEGRVPRIQPEQFTLIKPLLPDLVPYHPYGVTTMNYR